MCWVEAIFSSQWVCGELRRKDGVGRGDGCESLSLRWDGSRDRTQNSREGRNVRIMLGEVPVEISRELSQTR